MGPFVLITRVNSSALAGSSLQLVMPNKMIGLYCRDYPQNGPPPTITVWFVPSARIFLATEHGVKIFVDQEFLPFSYQDPSTRKILALVTSTTLFMYTGTKMICLLGSSSLYVNSPTDHITLSKHAGIIPREFSFRTVLFSRNYGKTIWDLLWYNICPI